MSIDIEWLMWYDADAKSDVFYCDGSGHSPVCIVRSNGKQILIAVDGEMKIVTNHPDTNEEYIIEDHWDLLEIGIKKDSDLKKLDDSEIEMSPWFDAYDISINYDPSNGVEVYAHLDMVSENIDEVMEKVKVYLKETK